MTTRPIGEELTPAMSIDEVIEGAYEQLAFDPGGTPNWDRFNELFADGAVLALRVFPSDAEISVLSLQAYAEAQMEHGLRWEGYSETPGERRTVIVGDVAYVHQNFTMNFNATAPQPAVDVFSLARIAGAWRIVAVLSDIT